MEPQFEALRLRRRRSELEDAMRRPGGIRIIEERELIAVRAALENYPPPERASASASPRIRNDRAGE